MQTQNWRPKNDNQKFKNIFLEILDLNNKITIQKKGD